MKKKKMEKQFAEDNLFCESFKEVMAKQKNMFEERIEQHKIELQKEKESNDRLIKSMAAEIKTLTEKKASNELENDELKSLNQNHEEMRHLLKSIVLNLSSLNASQDGIIEVIRNQMKQISCGRKLENV